MNLAMKWNDKNDDHWLDCYICWIIVIIWFLFVFLLRKTFNHIHTSVHNRWDRPRSSWTNPWCGGGGLRGNILDTRRRGPWPPDDTSCTCWWCFCRGRTAIRSAAASAGRDCSWCSRRSSGGSAAGCFRTATSSRPGPPCSITGTGSENSGNWRTCT